MIKFKSIAHPYARAIHEFAIYHNTLDSWQNMLNHMVCISNNINIKKIISSMSFFQQLSGFFISVCGKKIDKYGKNFIKILVEKKRLILLESIYLEFIFLRNIYENITHVTIISAYTLDENQLNYIQKILEKRLSKNIHIKCTINSDLINGFIIKFDDTVINLSVQHQLKNLLYFLQH